MDVVVRAVEESEVPAMLWADAAGFGEDGTGWLELKRRWIHTDLDRTSCAFDGGVIVGTSRNFSLEVTLPGGTQVPAAGVSAVAVLPTHRRRGLLTKMMTHMLDDAVERGEPVAMLTASESSIYQRFGFGVTTRTASVELALHAVSFSRPAPEGRMRLLTVDEAVKAGPEVFERVRAHYPGAVSRPDAWWTDAWYHKEFGTRFDAVVESPDGVVEGQVMYTIKEVWDPATGSDSTLTVRDHFATTPDAWYAIWRYVCEIDLMSRVRIPRLPVDASLPWLVTAPREARWTNVSDFVWHRVLDVPAALGARTYATTDRLVVAVDDPFRPKGAAAGTFAIDGGPEGAEVVASKDEPDLVCDVTTLSTAWLGGVRWTELAGAGLVTERTPGALLRADAMFASTPLPFGFTGF